MMTSKQNIMVLVLVSLLLNFYPTPVDGIDLIEVGADVAIALWDKINKYYAEPTKTEGPPKLMVRHGNRQKMLNLGKLLNDPANKAQGPFSFVYNMAEKLIKKKDIEECEMFYYDDGDQIMIDDNNSLLEAIESGADLKGNKRLIDVICETEGTEVIDAGIQYRKAKNAYDFAVMTKDKPSKGVQQRAENGLKEANLGGFELIGEGQSLLGVDGTKFSEKMDEIAAAYEWGPKQTSLLNAATASKKVSGSRSHVHFDPAKWKITGSFSRLFVWESAKDRYSMYCATSKFEFVVPKTERQGGIKDLYFYGEGGSIKQEFVDLIKTVLEYKAIEQSEKDIAEPQKDLFDNKDEL